MEDTAKEKHEKLGQCTGHHSFQPFQRELQKEFNQASKSHKLLGAE